MLKIDVIIRESATFYYMINNLKIVVIIAEKSTNPNFILKILSLQVWELLL